MSILGDTDLLQEFLCRHPRWKKSCHGTPIEFIKFGSNGIVSVQEVKRVANGINVSWMAALWDLSFLDNPPFQIKTLGATHL